MAPPIPNSQVARIPYQLKIHWGCYFCGVQVARAQGRKTFLTRGPSVEGNFDLGSRDTKLGIWVHLGKAYLAPNEVNGVGVHCARAVHVQIF